MFWSHFCVLSIPVSIIAFYGGIFFWFAHSSIWLLDFGLDVNAGALCTFGGDVWPEPVSSCILLQLSLLPRLYDPGEDLFITLLV